MNIKATARPPTPPAIYARQDSRARSRKNSGFSMIELLISVIILGILAAIAVPSFREFIAGQRVKNASFDIMAILTLTRSEAIKRNSNVTADSDGMYLTVTAQDGTVILRQEMPKDVTFTGGGAVIYGGNGRLTTAVSAIEISSSGSTSRRCISIDLSGRPNSKAAAC